MDVEFIEPASIELDDAIQYYNLQTPGLGEQFFDEILKAVKFIPLFPDAWTEQSKHTRKILLRKFPYCVVYTLYNSKIYILAIAHQHRKPEYWVDRGIE